jgi:GNAT superfamily N-acetyltransferase
MNRSAKADGATLNLGDLMDVEMKAEHAITAPVHAKIHTVLDACFPGYPARSYFKQLPHFRCLGWSRRELVAHMGVEHRMINNGGSALQIFGVVDLCVAASARSRGHARRLLDELEELGRRSEVDAVVLFADDPRLYLAAGYRRAPGTVKWLMVNEHQSIGIAERPVEELMVKMLNEKPWNPGAVDLLGHLF